MKKFLILFFVLLLASFGFSATSNYAYILEVDSTNSYPTTIYPNSEASINITLENISSTVDAEDVNVSLVPTSNDFEIITGLDHLDVIKFSQTGNFALRFKVKDSVKGGYYSIPVKIEYLRDGLEKYTINTQTTINVSNYDKINLVLTEYPLDKKYLDEKVELKGYVKNEGNNTLKGIKVEADFGTNKLIALDEKSKFLGDLDPGQTKDVIFTFLISKNATPALFDVDLNANAVGSISDVETVSFIVEDKPTVIISSIDKSLSTGETKLKQDGYFSLSIQLENISKSTIKSASMKILENQVVEGIDIAYVGSLEEDDSSSGIFDLHVLSNAETGTQKINVEISYLDQYDKEYTFTKEVPLFIVKKDISFAWLVYIIIIIGIGVGIYFYKKNKTKKKELRSLKGN
ncbi:MAG: hypothetical protein PHH82_01970 [Candidatus ainarchaeum sp.]|nr:hypothetical protein [Candidatus ainarchaeum sp.]